MPRYAIHDGSERYYMTFQVVGWVDIFTRKRYRDIVLESFTFCRNKKGLQLNAYVVMSNHAHLIAASSLGDLPGVVRDMKAHMAREILASIKHAPESRREWMLSVFAYAAGGHQRNDNYQLWTHENHPIWMDPMRPEMMEQRLAYIHNNPVRAGIVAQPADYLYSSASNYAGVQSLIEVDVLL